MDPQPEVHTRRVVRFGAFEADLHTGELRKYGVRIKVAEQPFSVLELLIERRGELVTREELKQHLWSQDTYVDFDRSLNAAVKKLRQTLNDSPRNPRFIQTLPKRGYRFIATVEVPAADAAPAQVSGQSEQPAARFPLRRITAVAAGVVVALGAASWLREITGSPAVPWVEAGPLRFEARPLFDLPGRPGVPALSPDGRSVAFSWGGEESSGEPEQRDIYIAAIDDPTPTQVTDNPDAERLVSWSPEGRRLAFTRRGKAGGSYVTSLLDGSETRVATVSTSPPSWTPDGKQLIGTYGRIWTVSLDTREQRDLIPGDGKVNYVGAAVSPDGETLAFAGCRRPSAFSSCDLYVRPIADGEPRRLTFQNGALEGLAWTPDSREIIYTMDGRMYRIPAVAGMQPGRLEFLSQDDVIGRFAYPSLARSSPGGNVRMTYVRSVRDVDIWVTETDEEAGSPHSYHKLIDSAGMDQYPAFSPDGRKIAFYSDRPAGDRALWVSDSDGSNPRQLTPSTFRVSDSARPAWSPDGLKVAFRASTPEDSAFHIYTVPLEGGVPQRSTTGDDESKPAWSRDGLFIYFLSNESGQGEVWRAPSDGSSPGGMPVNEMLSWSYAESPDGRFLYFCGVEKPGTAYGSLWRMPVEGGAKEEILRPFSFDALHFRQEGLYFMDRDEQSSGGSLVKLLDTETLKITEVARLPDPRPRHFSLSPDRRRILTSHSESSSANSMLVEDFR